tara:strand:- start:414 stop:680 length:267 start_codon:yes stop_codon:yes gene_type:complete
MNIEIKENQGKEKKLLNRNVCIIYVKKGTIQYIYGICDEETYSSIASVEKKFQHTKIKKKIFNTRQRERERERERENSVQVKFYRFLS